MEEYAILNLDQSRIENILFEYFFKGYGPSGRAKIQPTFKVECNVKNKIGLVFSAKSVEFILEYYTPVDSLNGAICNKINLSLRDFNNIINEIVSSDGYEIDYLDIKSINDYSDKKEKFAYVEYKLKKKEKVKTKKKGWR